MVWSKLKEELDRAGRAAQGALDEGKVRLDALRARQLADKAAQALGYAVYRARKQGEDVNPDTYARLSSTLAAHEAEITQIEARLEEMREARRVAGVDTEPPAEPAEPPPPPPPGP
jgi:TfoX/Sxy family transcriptional regulator of competence genes